MTVNTALRRLRRAQGFTQQSLAESLRVSLDIVKAWERGAVRCPHPRQLHALSQELHVSPDRLGFELSNPVRRAAMDITRLPWTPRGTADAVGLVCHSGVMERAEFFTLVGAGALTGSAVEWLTTPPAEGPPGGGAEGTVTDTLIDSFDDFNAQLRQLDDSIGGMPLLHLAYGQIRSIREILTTSRYTSQHSTRLHGTLAETLRIGAWVAFDIGRKSHAQHLWLAGLHAAHTAGEHGIAANIMGWMSDAYRASNPRASVTLAEAALQAYKGNNPKVLTILQLQAAKAFGHTGNHADTQRAVDAAFASWANRKPHAAAPGWSYWISERFLHGRSAGFSYYALGQWEKASHHLEQALALTQPQYVRDNALCYTMLATAQLKLGDAEKARTTAHKAIGLFDGAIPSHQCASQLHDFTRRLHATHPGWAAEITERLNVPA